MSAATDTRLGVDLGTTWTAAALQRADRVDALALGTNTSVMPSVVARVGDDIVIGEAAAHQLLSDPASGAREFKRRLGDTTPIVMGGSPYGAEALMGHLLRHVVEVATTTASAAPNEVVCTHPANWGEYKLDLLREAARLADVRALTLMPEPVAAALHYVRLGRLSAGDVVAVYDFGGGTFDAAVVQCTGEGASLLGPPEGLERLGGVDLDQIVIARVDAALDGRLRELDSNDPDVRRALVQLRADCTLAKEALSNDTEAAIAVSVPGLQTQVRITRSEFESDVRARVADTLGALDRAVANAHVEAAALAGVLLVGGSSRIPVVGEEVARHTGRPNLVDADLKLVVALGAAGGSTVMATTKQPAPAPGAPTDAAKDAAKDAPRDEKGAADAPASPAAKAAATAAALHAAADKKDAKKKPGGREGGAVTPGIAAGIGAVAAGVAATGYAATRVFGGGGGGDDHDAPAHDATDAAAAPTDAPPGPPPPDHSMDAFDHLGGGAGGGGRGFGGARHVSFGGGHEGGGGGGGGVVHDAPSTPAIPDIDAARADLLGRLDAWQPPAGADPAAVAEFRTELEGIVNRFHGEPGQSANDALADLRQSFDDHVRDFVQDQKIDVLVDEHQPAPQQGFDWVAGHYDTTGDWTPGHWERASADGVPNPSDDGGATHGVWVDGYYDDKGDYVTGHWDGPAPANGEPPPMHMPGWDPDGPGVPGTPSNPDPAYGHGPVIVRDHYPVGGQVEVRDHRGGDMGGGVSVTNDPRGSGGDDPRGPGGDDPRGPGGINLGGLGGVLGGVAGVGGAAGGGRGGGRGGQQGGGLGDHRGGGNGSNQGSSNDDNRDDGNGYDDSNGDGDGSDDGGFEDSGGFDDGGGFEDGGFDGGGFDDGGFDGGGFEDGGFDGGGFEAFAATVPADDPLGVDAFASASATAPALDLGPDATALTAPAPDVAVAGMSEPAPVPDPVPALVAAAPDPGPSALDAPGPLDAPVDVPSVSFDDGGSGGGDASAPSGDDTPSDLDNNPHTPQ